MSRRGAPFLLRRGNDPRAGGAPPAGAAPTPFTPADLPDLEAWYRETYAAGTWSDLSGNGRDLTQATAGARPTQVTRAGQLALSFDGGDFLRVSFSTLASPLTIYSVLEFVALSGATRTISDGSTTPRTQISYIGTQFSVAGSTTLAGGTPSEAIQALAVVANGASSAIYDDDFVTAAASGDAGTTTTTGITLGANRLDGSPILGYVWEYLLYSGAHNAATRKLIGDYLTARYAGLTVTT